MLTSDGEREGKKSTREGQAIYTMSQLSIITNIFERTNVNVTICVNGLPCSETDHRQKALPLSPHRV